MKILILFLILTGCVSTPDGRIYNIKYPQDPDCYVKYGGQDGYCDKGGR